MFYMCEEGPESKKDLRKEYAKDVQGQFRAHNMN